MCLYLVVTPVPLDACLWSGADKVVETDAKAVLITNSGLDLLGVVSPRSPLLSLVLQSIKVGLSYCLK